MFGRNTFWLWLDMGALRIGNLLAGFFLIRYFGPHNFGLYSTAIAVGFIVNALCDLGLTRYTGRAVAADRREAGPILAVTFLSTGLLAVLGLSALLIVLAGGYCAAAVVLAGVMLNNFEGSATLCSAMLTANLRPRQILPGSALSASCLVTMATLVIFLHWSVLTFVLLGIVRSFSVFMVRLWQLRDFWPSASVWQRDLLLRTVRSAWPFFTYNITQVGYGRISIVCFSLVAPQALVGIYSAAFVLSDVFPQWSYSASGSLLPLWTRLYEGGRKRELVETRESLLDVIVLLCVPIAITLSVFAPEICAFLGSRFADSAPVLRIIAYRELLSVVDGVLGHGFLIAVNQVRQRQRAQLTALGMLAVLTLAFGRPWGPPGVGIALLIADAFLVLRYLGILASLDLHIRTRFVLPVFFAGTCMAVAALATPFGRYGSVARLVAGLVTYSAILSLFSRHQLAGVFRTLAHCARGLMPSHSAEVAQ